MCKQQDTEPSPGLLYGSVKKEDHISGFGIRGDLTKLKIGFEYYETSISKYGIENTTYTNSSINAYMIAYAYALITYGQPIPEYSYAYAYS